MARVIKGNAIDDGQFPLPPDPHAQAAHSTPHPAGTVEMQGAAAGLEPAELQHALGELQQIVGMIHGMRPTVQELSETLRSGARERGYSEGIAQAQSEVHGQLVETLAALTAAQQERHRIAQRNESALAELALKIARKVVGEHLRADPTLVAHIVADTIRELEPSTALEVHVNPADLPVVENAHAELERLVQGAGTVTVIADDTVDQGGVVLTSPVGDVDARIETKFSVLQTAFLAQRRALVDGPPS
ncbi:MAG: sctL [Thermoleophilia bacterium]|nr:sctL [Thermoleophilia bacterium]